jgi:hydrogenase maturation protease
MIAVIGCGNRNRGDDGAGPAVVQMLKARRGASDGARVRYLDAGTDGMAVMFAARGCRSLILVDACRSGAPGGAIFEVPGNVLESAGSGAHTTHDFRWENALYAGRRLYRDDFPGDVGVFLIEVETVGLGLSLSPSVAAAANRVADRIDALLNTSLDSYISI